MMRHYECHARALQIMVKVITIKGNLTATPITKRSEVAVIQTVHELQHADRTNIDYKSMAVQDEGSKNICNDDDDATPGPGTLMLIARIIHRIKSHAVEKRAASVVVMEISRVSSNRSI